MAADSDLASIARLRCRVKREVVAVLQPLARTGLACSHGDTVGLMFGGGGRASSESFWPDPPQVIPARRLIGKSKVHGFVKVVPPFVKKTNFAKSKAAAAAVKVVDDKARSAANAKAPGTRATTAKPSMSSASTSRPSSSATADSGGSLLDALYPPRPKPKAESDTKPQCQTRMPRGTAGTWRGRRPPKTPEKLQAWLARKAAWEASHSKPKP